MVYTDWVDSAPNDSQVHVSSTWRSQQRALTSAGVMTDVLLTAEVCLQTIDRQGRATQTEDQVHVPQPASKIAKLVGLPEFLRRAEAIIAAELQRAVVEAEVLEPFTRAAADDADEEPPACIHFLSPFASHNGAGDGTETTTTPTTSGSAPSGHSQPLVVTCLSWSCTGQSIAAAYGRFDVEGWCTDPGALVVWNLARGDVDPGRPDSRVDVDNCLMSCAYHPAHPALIAGGTFNGELYVWDLAQDGDVQRAKSNVLAEVRHTEPIVSMVWQYSLTEAGKYGNRTQAYRLVTLGADGKVLVWVWHKLDAPIYGYRLLWPQPGADRKVMWGGTSMSFQRDPRAGGSSSSASHGSAAADGGTFMVGTEGGRTFRCHLDVNDAAVKEFAKAIAQGGDKMELRVPIKEADYQPHSGSIFGLDCSPFNRELFLTAGTDGTLRLCSALRQQPLLVLEPASTYLHAVQWSPARPLVFAVAAGDGFVYVYDLLRVRGLIRPAAALDVAGVGAAASGNANPVYALALNAKRPEWVATGDAAGIQIWKLPPSLSSARRGEEALLRKVLTADDPLELLRDAGGGR